MSRTARAVLGLALASVAAGALVALVWWPAGDGAARGGIQASLAVTEALGPGDPAGFARAVAPRTFTFPADLGPHPEFRTEWWYFTGHLAVDPTQGEGGGARSAPSAARRRRGDRKSTRLNSSHSELSRMPSSA